MPDIFSTPSTPSSSPVPVPTLDPPHPGVMNQIMGTYSFMPEGVRFETQEPGETIILLLRAHWFTNLTWVILGFILILFPVFLFPLLVTANLLPAWVPPTFVSVLIWGWYLVTLSYVLVHFLLWYFTVSIVTNERIIDIDFINILNKKFSETRISKIEDVTERTGGFIRTVFNYGDVIVQTAGTEEAFQFLAVPRPVEVVHIINELMDRIDEGGQS